MNTKLPSEIELTEVGPRDGLQNEAKCVSLTDRRKFIDQLVASGLKHIEVGSFVKPSAIPQMEGTADLLRGLLRDYRDREVSFIALVPNMQGLKSAMESGCRHIAFFTATSETFNQKNVNCTVRESLGKMNEMGQLAAREGIKVRAYISTAFGCPYEGHIPAEKTINVVQDMLDMGFRDIILGDTTGVGHPVIVEKVLDKIQIILPASSIGLHFHDTYNMALVNAYSAMQMGFYRFDASAGGLGGCPYARGASGNLASEDILHMAGEMGIKTNVDIHGVIKASAGILEILGRSSRSKVHQALMKKNTP